MRNIVFHIALFFSVVWLFSCSDSSEDKAVEKTPENNDVVQQNIDIPVGFVHVTQVIAGDFNRNGFQDVAVISKQAHMVIFNNITGSTEFADFKEYDISKPNVSMCSSDINNDGNIDIIPMMEAGVGQFLLGDGSGGFASANETLTFIGRARHMICVDINKDNLQDIIATGYGTVNIYINQGHMAFERIYFKINNMFINKLVSVADIDADGNMDILLPDFGQRVLYVIWNKGNNSFEKPVPIFYAEDSSMGAAVPINLLDGKNNPVIVYTIDGADELVFIEKTGADLQFKELKRIKVLSSPFLLNIADMNNDKIDDIVVSHHPDTTAGDKANIAVCYAPDFQCPDVFSVVGHPLYSVTTDWDGDGFLDIFVPLEYDAKKVVYMHSPGQS
ncbi:MAG: VCBS repeat-containing protein [Candidatus Magnetoovum sp. WYHC-5]|nr:VCBS repeat-containing protein [Candidatus Magnetoovum sp. WYHC-5]